MWQGKLYMYIYNIYIIYIYIYINIYIYIYIYMCILINHIWEWGKNGRIPPFREKGQV